MFLGIRFKLMSIVILSLLGNFIFLSNYSIHANSDQFLNVRNSPSNISLDDYEINVNPTSITIKQDEDKNVTVTLFQDSQPVSGAYFELLGIIYDIGESQYYEGNGIYRIEFTTNSTLKVKPGNYSVTILAFHLENTIEENFEINIISNDLINPVLNVIEPQLVENFNQTVFKVVLEAYDETKWMDLTISVGNSTIYYFSNPGIELNLPDLTYNQTYLYLKHWVNLRGIQGVDEDIFTITVRDTGFNNYTFSFELPGDYSGPNIRWISHQDNSRIFSRDITLEWEVTDDSEIKNQALKLNDRTFLPDDLSPNDRSIKFFLPIPDEKAVILTFTLVIADIYGNQAEKSLVLIYDSSEIGLEKDSIGNINYNILLPILIGLGIIIILVFYLLKHSGEDESSLSTVKISRKMRKTIENYPLDNVMDYLANEDIDETITTESIAKLRTLVKDGVAKAKSAENISNLHSEINILLGDLDKLALEEKFPEKFYVSMINDCLKWLNDIQSIKN